MGIRAVKRLAACRDGARDRRDAFRAAALTLRGLRAVAQRRGRSVESAGYVVMDGALRFLVGLRRAGLTQNGQLQTETCAIRGCGSQSPSQTAKGIRMHPRSFRLPRVSPIALGVAALLSSALAPVHAGDAVSRLYVTSCADDGSEGTLRSVLASAGDADIVDLTQLQCSHITLLSGALGRGSGSITLEGPGRDRLAIDANYASRVIEDGGPIKVSGLTIMRGRYTADHASGGCIDAFFGVELRDSTVTQCAVHGTTSATGGAIQTQYSVHVVSSTLSDNVASADAGAASGGAIGVNYGFVTVETSTITGNIATAGTVARGGGIFVEGSLRLTRTTVDGNIADLGGGAYKSPGIFSDDACDIVNSTISSNIASVGGGGLVCRSDHPSFRFTTITQNLAQSGVVGGALIGDPQGALNAYAIELDDSIIAGNSAQDTSLAADIDTTAANVVTSGDANVLTTIGRVIPATWSSDDPLLGPLADNGGLTRTHALLPESPAIDAGFAIDGIDTDQRGQARSAGAAPDIGAYELQPDAIFADGFDPA
jgi:hypothetical protein